jgi:hypothetical protein
MSDEVEVVIIATGFNGSLGSGFDTQNAAFRQASVISQRLETAYSGNMGAAPASNVFGGYTANTPEQNGYTAQPQMSYAQPAFSYPQTEQPAQAQPIPSVPYVQPIPVQQPTAPAEPVPFEPDDPIPETGDGEEKAEKRRRPRFVDFFMRRKKDDSEEK